MGRIPADTIRQIREATDIVALIQSYIPIKRAGTVYKGCCPFHSEKTPSFTVSPVRQSFKCFGCGEGGSAIDFVMKYENLPFADAVHKLAERAGIPIIEEAENPLEAQKRREQTRLIDLQTQAAQWFNTILLKLPQISKQARDYLAQRGFGITTAKKWNIGYAPESHNSFLTWAHQAGFSDRELVNSGLCYFRRDNDLNSGLLCRFHDRLMFPIADDYGKTVAFSGRILIPKENTGKYINSPETPVFTKGNVIFGLDKARRAINKEKFALVCEGQIDTIACHEAGIENAVAPLGTAFTPHHARLLRKYTSRVTLCFDGDSAGMKAADRACRELMKANLRVDLATLPQGDDPDSYIKSHGKDAFIHFVHAAKPFFLARTTLAKEAGLFNDAGTKADFILQMASLIALIADPIFKSNTIADAANFMEMSEDDMKREVTEAAKENKRLQTIEQERLRHQTERQNTQESYSVSTFTPSENYPTSYENTPTTISPKNQPVARLIPTERIVLRLCQFALISPPVLSLLIEKIEDLNDPLHLITGGFLLLKILTSSPQSPAEREEFLRSLSPSEELTLRQIDFSIPLVDEPEMIVDQLVGELIRLSLTTEAKIIQNKLKNVSLIPPEEIPRLFDRLKEISKLKS